jgi:hypothetical protein
MWLSVEDFPSICSRCATGDPSIVVMLGSELALDTSINILATSPSREGNVETQSDITNGNDDNILMEESRANSEPSMTTMDGSPVAHLLQIEGKSSTDNHMSCPVLWEPTKIMTDG